MDNDFRTRVLVVEDDPAVAEELAYALRHMRYTVIGPFSTAKEALASVGTSRVDVAILDVKLKMDMSFPVARYLEKNGIPFLFMSGSYNELTAEFSTAPVLTKPVRLNAVCSVLDGLLMKQAA